MFPRADHESAASRNARLMTAALARVRCRSFCFLEDGSRRWTVFLVTFPREDGQWRGYFTFRSADFETGEGEIRTADLFVETTEAGVDARARALGRPLLQALLESAIHTYDRKHGSGGADYNQWFRELLASRATEMAPRVQRATPTPSYDQLRSQYDSYRVDQVAHLIALMPPHDFRALVEQLLDGRVIDFQARDRFQLAMIVVQELQRRLVLPPFELWAEDYLSNADEYAGYSHQLRNGELP